MWSHFQSFKNIIRYYLCVYEIDRQMLPIDSLLLGWLSLIYISILYSNVFAIFSFHVILSPCISFILEYILVFQLEFLIHRFYIQKKKILDDVRWLFVLVIIQVSSFPIFPTFSLSFVFNIFFESWEEFSNSSHFYYNTNSLVVL